ncbi:MAG: imidazoleglycerol-phosphate dehydratase HisB [Ruminococcaceae bacterium]|nr:imidazoleglycerol-phosphate dehydratase HisB [Oscillospiraceae bacterium]
MREASITRKTGETDIALTLALEGSGSSQISSGVGFMDHMLTLFAKHGRFDLTLSCVGDTEVDGHHSVEDIGIALGQAFAKALGDCAGICRYGSVLLPMDEALIQCALDISGRGMLVLRTEIPSPRVGDFDTELVEEFLLAFVRHANITLHVRQLEGRNAHHIIEGIFKALGRALRQAVSIDETLCGAIPSTKGMLV